MKNSLTMGIISLVINVLRFYLKCSNSSSKNFVFAEKYVKIILKSFYDKVKIHNYK